MNRPWQRWLVFALCLAAVIGVLAWLTSSLIRSENTRSRMEQVARSEERIRLALWRMDSALTALIVEESARPASAYLSPENGREAVKTPSPFIRLHFQRQPDGSLVSPQATGGVVRLTREIDPNAPPPQAPVHPGLAALQSLLNRTEPPGSPEASGSAPHAQPNWAILLSESASQPETVASPSAAVQKDGLAVNEQQLRNSLELQSRANVFQQATQQAVANAFQPDEALLVSDTPGAIVFKAVWLGPELVLARRVATLHGPAVQGVWLDWPKLQASLLGSIHDLLPSARLDPLANGRDGDMARRLASIPAVLVAGETAPAVHTLSSPLRLSLALAWAGVLGASVAAAALLHGTLALSERRAAFVSAVTHELRTPLTTFKLYSEMLAEDMIPEPAQRKKYLTTLCAEAARLGHLVENVLSYARLERGRARQNRECLTARQLVERTAPRLAERAEQAGITLVTDTETPSAGHPLEIDVSAVEQILFNLVDNACKYAGPVAEDKRLHLEIVASAASPDEITLRVRDHGPGLTPEAKHRLFQPFSRSASAAAQGTPGVGLGLALCRRLSRSLGGSISLDTTAGEGASFLLRLPRTAAPTPQAETR